MAFWGIEVKPGKPFTHRFDESKGRLHVSMASLGSGTAMVKSVLQCNVGNKSPVFLCSLYPLKSESLQLNLEFEEVDEVLLSVIGPRSIHLSGYYLGSGRFRSQIDESESFGEDIADTESQKSDDEEEYEDSFINDNEPEEFSPSSASDSQDESFDDKKSQNRKGKKKRRLRKTYQVSESDEGEVSLPKNNTNGSSAAPELTSEDEDNCLISTFFMNGTDSKKGTQNEKNSSNPKMRAKDVGNDDNDVERNTDDSTIKGQQMRQSDNPIDSLPTSENGLNDGATLKKRKERSESEKVKGGKTLQGKAKVDSISGDQQTQKITEDSEIAAENDERPKKKRKSESKKEKKTFDSNISDIKESREKQDIAKEEVIEANGEKESEEKKVKKRKKKKNKSDIDQENEKNNDSPVDVEHKNNNAKGSKAQTLENGLVIEKLKSGESDGKVAVSGKKISVRYVCKSKITGQVVDSNTEDDLLKFRLGARKVVEGWEIGLEGMQVGEKRRLTVPPLKGYVYEGDGKNVPRDSWLVYEVELVRVRD